LIGRKISHYNVTEKLGAGGMGEVYRATDTKLNRDVALKVLPEEFARDADRMARFKREAQVLASLNHPNIAAIYGLEESEGIRCLVLELVEGPTLAERIKQGAIPLDEALNIAKQIAEALEAAHEKGIIHRDLKPANVKVTPEGMVKVLDFGLAKALEDDPSSIDISKSPTLSVAATQAGVILGTAAYMSPEQAHGRQADKRADIWSFGVVLYEMLTGRQAFSGESISDTLASVLKLDPDWDALPSDTPAPIRKLLRRCLTKDRKQRLQAIGDARLELDEVLTGGDTESPLAAALARVPLWQRVLPWSLAALLLIATAFMSWGILSERSAAGSIVMHASLTIDAPVAVVPERPALALSPDGRRLVYVGRGPRGNQLYLREMDKPGATPLSGTEGASGPFFSPDGESVGFVVDEKDQMKIVSLSGGAPVIAGKVPPVSKGATWGPNETILHTPSPNAGLHTLSANEGTREQLTAPDIESGERSHRWPQFLPDGQTVLFTLDRGGSFDDAAIAVLSLETRKYEVVLEGGSCARYVPSGLPRAKSRGLSRAKSRGHLVFARNGALYAVPFDLGRLSVTGNPVQILAGVATDPSTGAAHFAVSPAGTLAYLPGVPRSPDRRLVWVNRRGEVRPTTTHQRSFFHPKLSPDGRRVAVAVNEGSNSDIWVLDTGRDALTRLTFDPGEDFAPIWTLDGKMVTHASEFEGGGPMLSQTPANGSGSTVSLTPNQPTVVGSEANEPASWSPDGKTLIFNQDFTIWTLELSGDGKSIINLENSFLEAGPRLSPDGRWLAYHSNESGRDEVYVRSFPVPDQKFLISTDGGAWPVWNRNGRELFYRIGNEMMVVDITYQPAFAASVPRVLFKGSYEYIWGKVPNYDVSPDGRRFLMIQTVEPDTSPGPIGVITNWFDELRRLAPSDKD
jgi:serine/threonine-protein kinase